MRARRDEIIAALAQTAKPYFGDVEAMTYLELLARFTERCATGRFGRYDDGAWGHPSWRARALALFERFAARLTRAESGPIAVALDLDDPAAALRAFARALPGGRDDAAAPRRRPVLPRGLRPRRASRCRSCRCSTARSAAGTWPTASGRPRTTASTPTQVFVIPGPEAVAGITRADEPVAELLARFEAAAIARAGDARAARAPRRPGPAPGAAERARRRSGPDRRAAAPPSASSTEDGRTRPNPLWRLSPPATRSPSTTGT